VDRSRPLRGQPEARHESGALEIDCRKGGKRNASGGRHKAHGQLGGRTFAMPVVHLAGLRHSALTYIWPITDQKVPRDKPSSAPA